MCVGEGEMREMVGETDLQAEDKCLCDCSCAVMRGAARQLVDSQVTETHITKKLNFHFTKCMFPFIVMLLQGLVHVY